MAMANQSASDEQGVPGGLNQQNPEKFEIQVIEKMKNW
jgi:hypothetical protein